LAEVPERTKTRTQLVEEAINAALDRSWETALELNREIADRFGVDEETHNRLGKAYTELGKLDDALTAYRATLELNPLNAIAIKNVNRLEALIEEKADLPKGQAAVDINLFVEEMGKSALANVVLDKRFDPALVAPGDEVELVAAGDTLDVVSPAGKAIGTVEPKLARRVLKFMAGGNKYAAVVATGEEASLRIIIRETYQAADFAGQPSFPASKSQEFRAYAKDSLLRDVETEDLAPDESDESGVGGAEDEDLEGMHAVEPGDDDAADLADEDGSDNY
jgi:tetratricopeptide (TPR) repeat protein